MVTKRKRSSNLSDFDLAFDLDGKVAASKRKKGSKILIKELKKRKIGRYS